jgi:ubiquinone/menaquinone biosynthesis C-methylase UbiE
VTSTSWQLASDSARRYEQILVPAILGPAARAVVERAPVSTSRRTVDLGCGTGAAIRLAARSAPADAQLIGIDNNRAMLEVARGVSPEGRRPLYCAGSLLALPLGDASCDLLLCAQTLQFVGDYEAAARQMRRVLAPEGTLALGLWCPVHENPYFAALMGAIESSIGERSAAGMKAIFNLSNSQTVVATLESAGFSAVRVSAVDVKTDFAGHLARFIPRHISATPIATAFREAPAKSRRAVVDRVVDQLGARVDRADDGALFRTWVFLARP